MTKNYFIKYNCYFKYTVLPLLCMIFGSLSAQTSYVGNGSTLYFNGSILSSQEVVPDATATINMTAASTFTGTGFVTGALNITADGTTIVPVGDGTEKSTITVTTANNDDQVSVRYHFTDPASISTEIDPALTDFYLSDTEYWQVEKVSGTSTGFTISGTAAHSSATYEDETPTAGGTKLVWYNGSQWEEYLGTDVTGYFSYVGENTTLSTDAFDPSTIRIYPNPVKRTDGTINFTAPSRVQQLDITLYNLSGKAIQTYTNVPVHAGENSINKPIMTRGIYFLHISFDKGEHVTTKKLILE